VEKLITLAKEPTVHHRRLAKARLGNRHDAEVKKLFDVLGPRFKSRPGGYTRILKIAKRRLGDGGEQAILEFVERTPGEEPAAPVEAEAAAEAKPKRKRAKQAEAEA
jgi:large subunit ribosomal protein L17